VVAWHLFRDVYPMFVRRSAKFCPPRVVPESAESARLGCDQECPDFGVCVDYKLRCVPGYIRQGNVCVENEEVSSLSNRLMDVAVDMVSQHAADFQCGFLGANAKPSMSKEELEIELVRAFPAEKRKDTFRQSFEQMVVKLKQLGPPSGIRFKGDELYAVHSQPSARCAMKQAITQHSSAFAATALAFALTGVGICLLSRRSSQRRQRKQLVQDIIHHLMSRGGQEVSVEALRVQLWKNGSVGVWNKAKAEIDRDLRVGKLRAKIDHVIRDCWRWSGGSAPAAADSETPTMAPYSLH